MNVFLITRWYMLTALLAVSVTVGWNQRIVAQQPQPQQPQPNNRSQPQQAPAAGQDGMEVLTRGPVHEAFAETITFDPEPGIVAPKAPPADIEEVPPLQKPAAANLAWIPGYWAWDDERNDFLWLSGIWRALPPGRQWVPGYWGPTQQGSQWTSGYWADAAASEIDYLPEPPATVEAGPNVAAPTADDIWLPGSWVWQQNRYAWRPGYWTKGKSRLGLGAQTTTCGRPAAMSSSTATTTTRFRVAGSCLHPSILTEDSAASAVSPTHRRR